MSHFAAMTLTRPAIPALAALLLLLLTTVTSLPVEDVQLTSVTSLPVEDVYQPDKRIVNGDDAAPHTFPFLVSLQVDCRYVYSKAVMKCKGKDAVDDCPRYQAFDRACKGKDWAHNCGGSLIAPSWILTAAHCIDFVNITDLPYQRAVLGEYDLNVESEGEKTVEWEKVIVHDGWDNDTLQDDIGLIKLKEPVTTNQFIQFASLSCDTKDNLHKEECLLVGWGWPNNRNQRAQNVLQQTKAEIVPYPFCKLIWQSISDDQVCVQDTNPDPIKGYSSACSGDSGGPMMCGDGYKTVKGVTSFVRVDLKTGEACYGALGPDVYTKVSSYIEWIETQTGPLPVKDKSCH